MNYTIIDGFSFSYPRIFNGANFNHDIVFREHTRVKQEESFIPNVIQLFKLHGSIDWEKQVIIYTKRKYRTSLHYLPGERKI